MKTAWPWLKYTAWPWINEHVDLEGDPLRAGDEPQSIAQIMDNYCHQLETWLAQQRHVHSNCQHSIQMLGCDFLHLVGAGLTECPKGNCSCEANKAATLARYKWATQVIDAFGKIPAAVEQGNFLWLGDWESCRKVSIHIGAQNASSFEKRDYNGRYCSLNFKGSETTSTYVVDVCQNDNNTAVKPGQCRPPSVSAAAAAIHWGICAPRTCSLTDLNYLASAITIGSKAKICYANVTCPVEAQWVDHPGSIFMTIFCALLGLLLIAATAFDEVVYAPAVQLLPPDAVPLRNAGADQDAPTPAPAPTTRENYYNNLGNHCHCPSLLSK